MSRITINGRSFSGSNVTITNGSVIIDGKVQDMGEDGLQGDVIITGNVERLEVKHGSATVQGVTGDVRAGGSVQADDVRGHVTAGGSVQCDDVKGSVSAGGSVQRR